MDKMVVLGGARLSGEVKTSGAKNASLPILFSTLLADGKHVFHRVPRLRDIDSTLDLLNALSVDSSWDGSQLILETRPAQNLEASYDLVRKMRASILCLGPLLTRYGEAYVSMPGGCAIGTRPIDLHLEGLKAMGANIELKEGYVKATAKRLKGATIFFEIATVGGTQNLLMAAALAEGITTIENAAKEPEVVALANYINAMGGKVTGAGTSTLRIEGVDRLHPAEVEMIPDRIEAGTLLIAGALTGGTVTVTDCEPKDLEALLFKLKESGFGIHCEKSSITLSGVKEWLATDITTQTHPLFPTDLQAQFMALMTLAKGTCVVTETVFENRFMHVQELIRMGADLTPKSRVCVVRGVRELQGAPVMATDLRASASLVLAGLAARGETHVSRIYHLDRGYEKLEEKLQGLGAKIKRVKED